MTLLLAMATALVARAEDCAEPMSRIQLGAAVGEVTDALAASELIEARETLNRIHDRLPCLEEVVDRELFAMFARANAIVYYYGQEEGLARRWGVASRMADADLAWDEHSFPPDNPVRRMIEQEPVPKAVRVPNKALSPPRGGGVFLNGAFAAVPAAPSDAEILVQVFDRGGRRVDAFWQDGAAFPDTLLAAGNDEQRPPSWWTGDAPAVAEQRPVPMPDPIEKKPRPKPPPKSPFPVVPVASAGVLAAVAGGSYAFAWQTKQQLGPASSDQVAGIRTRANTLVLVSGVTLAGAIGVGVGGVLVSADGVTIRF